jgi:hypothetical protein
MGVGRWKTDFDFDAGTVPKSGLSVADFAIPTGFV